MILENVFKNGVLMNTKYTSRYTAKESQLPDYDFPRHGNYRCICCDSRSGPFFDDRTGKKGLDFLCYTCHNEIVEVRQMWAIDDSLKEQGL